MCRLILRDEMFNMRKGNFVQEDIVPQLLYRQKSQRLALIRPYAKVGIMQFITSKSLARRAHTLQYCNAISAFWRVSGVSKIVTASKRSLNMSKKTLGLVKSCASAELAISFDTFMKLLSFKSAI